MGKPSERKTERTPRGPQNVAASEVPDLPPATFEGFVSGVECGVVPTEKFGPMADVRFPVVGGAVASLTWPLSMSPRIAQAIVDSYTEYQKSLEDPDDESGGDGGDESARADRDTSAAVPGEPLPPLGGSVRVPGLPERPPEESGLHVIGGELELPRSVERDDPAE